MNYPFTGAAIAFAAQDRVDPALVGDRAYIPYPALSGEEYGRSIDRLLGLYPWEVQHAQLNLLDSHDTARCLTLAGNDEASLRLASLLLFTFPGAPCVYYGDEIGLTGGIPDRWARKSFPWERPEVWNRGLLEHYRELIALRRAHPALRTGRYRSLTAEGAAYAFLREGDGEALLVAVNAGDTPAALSVPLGGDTTTTTRLLCGEAEVAESAPDAPILRVPARTGAVLALRPSTGV